MPDFGDCLRRKGQLIGQKHKQVSNKWKETKRKKYLENCEFESGWNSKRKIITNIKQVIINLSICHACSLPKKVFQPLCYQISKRFNLWIRLLIVFIIILKAMYEVIFNGR